MSIPLTFSPKKCGTGHTFGGCGTLSCVAFQTLFSSHFWPYITSRSPLLPLLLGRWYPRRRPRRLVMLNFVILRLCVPFPYAGPSQLFLICRVRVVNLYDAFITLSRQACSKIRYGKNGFLFLPIVHGRKDGGCCSTWTLKVPLTRDPSLVLLA